MGWTDHDAAKLVPMVPTLVDQDGLAYFELVGCISVIAHHFGPRPFMASALNTTDLSALSFAASSLMEIVCSPLRLS